MTARRTASSHAALPLERRMRGGGSRLPSGSNTASKTISRLAALGFVERRAEAGDGRIVRVRLTETGLAKAEAIERIWDEVEAELLAGFDNKERRRLRKLLRKVARNLADASGVAGQETEADAEIEAEDDEADAPGLNGSALPAL